MEYALLIAAVILNALANVLLKAGASRLPGWGGPGTLAQVLTNPFLLAGLSLFALNVVLYAAALTRLHLSMAYPVMVAGGLILVVLASVIWLREPITGAQVVGITLLVAGILLVTRGEAP